MLKILILRGRLFRFRRVQRRYNKIDYNMDVWELIQNGYFEDACKRAEVEYEESGNIFPLRNKVYALLHLKRYDEVISVAEFLIKVRNGESDTDYIFCGIAHWLNKNQKKAVQIWQSAENCKYTDAAGGIELQIILYFSGIKLQNEKLISESKKKIRKLLKSKKSINWPGALGMFVLKDITKEELFNSINLSPILKERQLCQSAFTIAVTELENNNKDAYLNELKNCLGYGSRAYIEQFFYLAKGEVDSICGVE